MSGYNYLNEGMIVSEVDLVLDCSGKETASAGSLKTIIWQDGFKIITATFDGGRLVSKAQSGL